MDRFDEILSYRFGLPVGFLRFSSEPVCGVRGPSVMGGVRPPVVVELDPSSDACAGLVATAPGIEIANSATVRSPFTASSATRALNSGLCCLRFDIADLLLVEDQQNQYQSLRHCPIPGE